MRWLRLRILQWLGVVETMQGLRADLDAHQHILSMNHRYQVQMEEKLQMVRMSIPNEDGKTETLVLVSPSEMKQLRKESRERAREARSKDGR